MQKLKVIIADDHAMYRQGLSSVLKEDKNLDVIAEAENGKVLLDYLTKIIPDVIILDLDMPVMNGYETLEIISQKYPYIRVIINSIYQEKTIMLDLISKGAHGFVPKCFEVIDLIKAIKIANEDGYYISKSNGRHQKSVLPGTKPILTAREKEILKLLIAGKKSKEIAALLKIELSTVNYHKENIYVKTNTDGIAQLVCYSLDHDLV